MAKSVSSAKTARSSGRTGASPARFSLWIAFGFLILILDQATKFWFERHLDPGDFVPVIDGFFNLTLAHNYGAAFSFLASMGGWQRWLFSAIALAVIVVALRLLWKHSRQTLFALSLTLILSGALGNLIDRSLWGYVIDFLDFYLGTWHWPAFNIADTAICLGAAGIIIDELIGVSKERS